MFLGGIRAISVIFEAKDRAYDPVGTEEVWGR